jgi:hypothetical protein
MAVTSAESTILILGTNEGSGPDCDCRPVIEATTKRGHNEREV